MKCETTQVINKTETCNNNNNNNILDFIICQQFKIMSKLIKELAFKKDCFNSINNNIKSFINIIYTNGVLKKFEISQEEIRILKIALYHNYGYINLRSNKKEIQSLMRKGFIELKLDERYSIHDLALTETAKMIFKQNTKIGFPLVFGEVTSLNERVDECDDNKVAAVCWCLVENQQFEQ